MVDVDRADGGYLEGQFSLRDILTIVFKRRVLIATFAVGVFTLVTLLTLLTPRIYEVTSTLLVNEARAEVPLAPKESQQLIINQVTEQDVNSEIEVLRSRKLVEEVLLSLKEEGVEAPDTGLLSKLMSGLAGKGRESAEDKLVIKVQEDLEVDAVRKSNVIRVTYTSTDPEWTTGVVATLVSRYLQQRAERYQSPQALSFYAQQMKDAEQQLADREKALEDFARVSGITMVKGPEGSDSLAAQKGIVMQRLASLETDLGNARVDYEAKLREVTSLGERLAQEPERLASSNRLNQDAATEEIERALAQLQLERDRLLQDFKPDSRFVRDVEAQISRAEEQLAEARKSAGVSRTETNPVYLQLKSELVRAEADLAGITARVASLEGQTRASRQNLDTLNARSFELESLRREARAAEETYLLFRNKHEEARISAAMDQEQFINVTVAQPAQLPLRPVRRGLLIKMILGLLIGVMGGIGIAFALEQFLNRSFTTGEDIERRLGIPHLASIPDSAQMG